MKICALLSFYDESPHWLSTCVAGIGRWCDALICCDGAYFLYPRGRPRSHPQQIEAIHLAAETANLELLLYQPRTTWGQNEVGKRTFMLQLAGTVCTPGEDWVAVVDADYHLLRCETENIRDMLANTDLHVASYTLMDGKDFLADPKAAPIVAGQDLDYEWTISTRDIHRWNPTLKIWPQHWTYSAVIDGERRWVRGPWEKQVECVNLAHNLVMYHRTQDRSKIRRDAADRYYQRRIETGIEWMGTQDVPSDEEGAEVLARIDAA